MKSVTYVEIDLPFCELTYGVPPCTAAVGVTGDAKCFNTIATCQDRVNFSEGTVTFRFAVDSHFLPREIEAIPNIQSVQFQPATVSLGQDLGQRATLTVAFTDHPHNDRGAGFDKYVTERPYDPWERGTFWSKFRARQPYMRGKPIRLIRGLVGQSLAEMDTRHYVVESFDGPDPQGGTYTIVAKDLLKFADEDRAQAPRLSDGSLLGSIDNSITTATLDPAGIGNLQYPASGFVCFGGKEVCSFTRVGDVLTIVRGQLGTQAQQHDAGDRAQLVLRYPGTDAADILADLFENYAGIDAAYIPLAEWQAETAANLSTIYAVTITEPTSVQKLASELVEQAALAVWWDDQAKLLRLQVLKEIATDAEEFNEERIIEGSLQTKEQPDKRISQIWTYFGQRNPTQNVDDEDNYRASLATVDLQRETDYGVQALRTIKGRFVAIRAAAERLNGIQMSRFRDPPRRFAFSVFTGTAIELGGGYRLGWWGNVDATGERQTAPIQVVRLSIDADTIRVEAEEMLASGVIVVTQVVFLTDVGAVNTWEVPATWNYLENSIEVIGGGGAGAAGGSSGGAGGGGGGYSAVFNQILTPGAFISYRVGDGGLTNSDDGEDSFFGAPTYGASTVAARGGTGGIGRTDPGTGGQASSGIGTTKFSGGDGGTGASAGESRAGGGGGGASAGPNGDGGNGGNGGGTGDDGGAGGGGADGGADGADHPGGGTGAAGGNNRFNFGGGRQGGSNIDGQQGGGGAGGNTGGVAGLGGDGAQIWTQTVTPIIAAGPGGGGGGGGSGGDGGRAGSYGGAGGGGGQSSSPGIGTQGIIVISWREAD